MTKYPYAFNMQHYKVEEPHLLGLKHCLSLSQPEGFDLSRFFPKDWRGKSCVQAQNGLPSLCPDAVLIATSQKNAECRQLTFVQNFFNMPEAFQKEHKNAQEYVRTLRKHIAISTLSDLLFSYFDIYTIKCPDMGIFEKAKEQNQSVENYVLSKGGSLDLEIVPASGNFLSPYEKKLLGFLVIPQSQGDQITLQVLERELKRLNEYHSKHCIYSTKHF